jgi:hypothetical protein
MSVICIDLLIVKWLTKFLILAVKYLTNCLQFDSILPVHCTLHTPFSPNNCLTRIQTFHRQCLYMEEYAFFAEQLLDSSLNFSQAF